MARGNREQRRRQETPAVVVTDEDGVPSLMRHIAQEEALQEGPQGWQRIEGGEKVHGTVEEDAEFLREVQQSLDTDGIDTLDHSAEISDSALSELAELAVHEPAAKVLQQVIQQPLDARSPMSPSAIAAVAELLARSIPRPGVRPRMTQDRLEMRIRIPERWQKQHPKRPGTIAHENWLLYVDQMTVSAYLETHDRRRARADLQWDVDHGFVYLQSASEYAAEVAEAHAMALEQKLEDES